MLERQGSKAKRMRTVPGLSSLVGDGRSVDGVHQGAAQAGSGVGERVDGLHDSGVGGGVEGVQPVAHFVRDVDLPLATRHALSIPIAIPGRQVG